MKKFILAMIFSSVFISVAIATEKNPPEAPQVSKTENIAGDHNSTRSNRGTLVSPEDTDSNQKPKVNQLHNISQPAKGRNPQTGKEIIIAKKIDRTGRNPQTGKEINTTKKKD